MARMPVRLPASCSRRESRSSWPGFKPSEGVRIAGAFCVCTGTNRIHCMRLAMRSRIFARGLSAPAGVVVVSGLAGLAGMLFAAVAALPAQQPAAKLGSIHGRVINPAGSPQKDGTVSLSVDGGVTLSFNFPVASSGDYSGEAPPGEYTVVYRAPDTPQGKIVDYISGVQIVAGQDTAQDVDMTRREFFGRLSPEQQRQLLELREANEEAESDAKRDASSIAADLQIVNLDFAAAENARTTAAESLGGGLRRRRG